MPIVLESPGPVADVGAVKAGGPELQPAIAKAPARPRLLCALDEPIILAGGALSGTVVLDASGAPALGGTGRSAELPNVYFRLIGSESVRLFEAGSGVKSASRVFIDTVFSLAECAVDYTAAIDAWEKGAAGDGCRVRFRFGLPRSLPPSISFDSVDGGAWGSAPRGVYIDSSSGIHYCLFASFEPVSHDLIRRMELGKAGDFRQQNSSIELCNTLQIDAQQQNDCFAGGAGLRFQIDTHLDETVLHRGPVIVTGEKRVGALASLFGGESRVATLGVTVDQYVIILGTAFPILISLGNRTLAAVERIESRLVAKISLSDPEAGISAAVEHVVSTGAPTQLSVPPGGALDDHVLWVTLPSTLRMPSAQISTLIKVSHELEITAVLAGGAAVTVRAPVFLIRGLQVQQAEREHLYLHGNFSNVQIDDGGDAAPKTQPS